MGLGQKLVMRQGQSLVMTPQLSQSIKLLTLSNIELNDFVQSEIERNPLLEHESEYGQAETSQPESSSALSSTDTVSTELETSAQNLSENLGTNLENVYPDEQDYKKVEIERIAVQDPYNSRVGSGGVSVSTATSSHDGTIADNTAGHETLRDKLQTQLAMSATSFELKLVASHIIDSLDEAGYLRASLEDIAARLGSAETTTEEALKLVQTFDPIGVGARDLCECLSLQLADQNRLDPAIELVLQNLDLLAKRDFAALSKISGLGTEDLHDALMEIRGLDPKPGTAFESGPVQHIVPDIFVDEAADGSWKIELNTDTLPRVLINNAYVSSVDVSAITPQDREFISNCQQSASWLTKSLDQRAQTILKVSTEIIKQQDAFLVRGVRYLRPLTLKMVADAIEMHESTVSRVTTNKYMMTPRGLFELKYFFTTGIASTDSGETHSSESVRDRIKSLIDAETTQAILSDDALVVQLKREGIEIARRTVAKYREEMHIPSSVQRRREKKTREQVAQTRENAKTPAPAH